MKYWAVSILLFLFVFPVRADGPDADNDRVSDYDETEVYYTNPNNADTDGDGFDDWAELNSGFSPFNPGRIKLEESDFDKDGLSDRMEYNFHTNPALADSDGDGYSDGEEIKNGFDPKQRGDIKLEKRIEINLAKQELSYFLGGVRIEKFKVSTGKPATPTPKGGFKIDNKTIKAWSKPYGLWMPYWMSLKNGVFGIHELPYWPSGYREGTDHLGMPVSHGCIRLGIGPAKTLYDWTEIGTLVAIY